MSYIRAGWPMKYVEGDSKDYVFCCVELKVKDKVVPKHIVDYGGISDSGFIELLCEWWETNDTIFKEHMIMRLAKRLGVKLRKRALSNEVIFDIMLGKTEKLKKKANQKHPDEVKLHDGKKQKKKWEALK